MTYQRRFPIGTEVMRGGGAHVRVWAPKHDRIEVVDAKSGRAERLDHEANGYHSGSVPFLEPGTTYGFKFEGDAKLYPDPASRFQPQGPHGPSQVVDPSRYVWRDRGFPGLAPRGLVIYELHVGTFTREGTWRAAAAQLPELAELGITAIEMMPIADFPGRFGWGYDGVDLWAPTRLYGEPDDLRAFADRAHELGIGVLLDVVYNHIGPSGNYLPLFSADYFSDRYQNEWGDPLNFDGANSEPVREFFVQNARYWIEEFHFDGLRLDATQSIHDASPRHVIAEITEAARAGGRVLDKRIYIAAENEPQETRLVRAVERGGCGCDALWNDDLHHSARVALTGSREAYYTDYLGRPQELISGLKWGYLYQGQHYAWQKQRRGTPAFELHARNFVSYLQNHDQVANSIAGERIDRLTSPQLLRAMTALFLLAPPTPLLFQGQEFAASAPFLFFADHEPELATLVERGRREFLSQFPSIACAPEYRIAPPAAPETFERCKLDFSERTTHAPIYLLHRDLLRMRRELPAISQESSEHMHGSVLGEKALILRFLCAEGDVLLCTNLGADLDLSPLPEPLLAPPRGHDFRLHWSSENPRYGGKGTFAPHRDGTFRLPAQCTLVFVASQIERGESAA